MVYGFQEYFLKQGYVYNIVLQFCLIENVK